MKQNDLLVFNWRAHRKGLVMLNQIWCEDELLDYGELIKQWPETLKWLEYESLKASIPH